MEIEQFSPKPNNWFSSTVEYIGWARAEFDSPAGIAEGPATISYDESGEMQGEVEV